VKSTSFNILFAAVGVVCAAVLIWLWRESFKEPAAQTWSAAPPASRAASSAGPGALPDLAPDISPAARRLLDTLQLALTRWDTRPNEAVLTFKDNASLQRFLQRAPRNGLTVLGQLNGLRAVRVQFDDLNLLRAEFAEQAKDYTAVGANSFVRIPLPPTREDRIEVEQVPFGNEALAFLGASGDRSTWGRGTTIAILDTGVAADPTFGPSRLRTLDIGRGLGPDTANAKEGGHGTAVAALAAGSAADAPGVAPAANILSIRVTDTSGTSDIFTIAQAIVAAVDAGARIVNVSLGGYTTGAVLDAAIGYATQQGALIVAAAGNDQAAQLTWPAADSRVVSVGAVDKMEQQVTFSNSGAQLQLSAPGYGVQTAWLDGQRVYVDGTSASAPLVAGAVAALVSQNPSLSPRQAADVLARTANDTGQPGADPAFGHGIINLATALNGNNASYVDTAVSSHFYDAETNQMQFVVQNRSGRPVSGLSLSITTGTTTSIQTVPSLAAGETYVAKAPVNDTALSSAGSLLFFTQLNNPPGLADQVPLNNKRSSVLSEPEAP